MQQQVDKIIRDKVNSLAELPEGYAPNLHSKWMLLEAGLGEKKAKRGMLISFRQAAAAAVLLIMGGLAFMMMNNNSKNTPEAIAVKPSAPVVQENKAVASLPVPNLPVIKKRVVKKPTPAAGKKQTLIAHAVPVEPLPVIETTEELTPLVAAVPAKKKVPRYTEIDYTNPVVNESTPVAEVVAAQQFRFRLGLHSVSSAGDAAGNGMKLRKPISIN